MLSLNLKSEPCGDKLNFYDTMELIYKYFKNKSIRVFGTRIGDGDVQLKWGYFENSIEVYLPYDHYDFMHVSEIIKVIDDIFTPPSV